MQTLSTDSLKVEEIFKVTIILYWSVSYSAKKDKVYHMSCITYCYFYLWTLSDFTIRYSQWIEVYKVIALLCVD